MQVGQALSTRSRQTVRTIEGYLKTGGPPRWMERVMTIDNRVRRERRRLAALHARLREEDPAGIAERWHALASAQSFDELNELILQPRGLRPLTDASRSHPPVRPIERDLPMGPEWVLEHFPAEA